MTTRKTQDRLNCKQKSVVRANKRVHISRRWSVLAQHDARVRCLSGMAVHGIVDSAVCVMLVESDVSPWVIDVNGGRSVFRDATRSSIGERKSDQCSVDTLEPGAERERLNDGVYLHRWHQF